MQCNRKIYVTLQCNRIKNMNITMRSFKDDNLNEYYNVVRDPNSLYCRFFKQDQQKDKIHKFGQDSEFIYEFFQISPGTTLKVVSTSPEIFSYDIDGRQGIYAGFRLENGQTVSIQTLMGLTSLAGYGKKLEAITNNSNPKTNESEVLLENDITRDNPYVCWNCGSRKLSEVILALEARRSDGTTFLPIPKKVTYRGKVGRTSVAKRDFVYNGKRYSKGDKWHIIHSIWSVD